MELVEEVVIDDDQFLANLNADHIDDLSDNELRRACQLVLQREMGPVSQFTRNIYKIALSRALVGQPIIADKEQANPGTLSESEQEDLFYKESTPGPSSISETPPPPPRFSSSRISPPSPDLTRTSYTSIKRSTFIPSSPPPPRPSLPNKESHFLRNAFIVGIIAVIAALYFASLLSD